jgi:hypothetical protein
MDNLPFQNEKFDVIWSEGAIANYRFSKGLELLEGFLMKDGYIAVTYEYGSRMNDLLKLKSFGLMLFLNR